MVDSPFFKLGGIGSQSPELSRYILDPEDLINEILFNLQGYLRVYSSNGKDFTILKPDDSGARVYNTQVIAWVRLKLKVILNKNLYLSRYNTEEDMIDEARSMYIAYAGELFERSGVFELDPEDIENLCQLYLNLLIPAIRRALYQSDKDFLTKTTSETTQRIQQDIEQSRKDNGFLGIFKRG